MNPQWLELPISRTNVHDPKDVRAIEVRLYYIVLWFYFSRLLNRLQEKNIESLQTRASLNRPLCLGLTLMDGNMGGKSNYQTGYIFRFNKEIQNNCKFALLRSPKSGSTKKRHLTFLSISHRIFAITFF